MKTAELTGAALDFWVAKIEGLPIEAVRGEDVVIGTTPNRYVFAPTRKWAHGGPIIERERIRVTPDGGAENPWFAECTGWPHAESDGIWHGIGPTPLIAAMRAYVASKLGEEVEIP